MNPGSNGSRSGQRTANSTAHIKHAAPVVSAGEHALAGTYFTSLIPTNTHESGARESMFIRSDCFRLDIGLATWHVFRQSNLDNCNLLCLHHHIM